MHPWYSVMGVVAGISNRMSRFSINAIPSNLLFILFCAFCVLIITESEAETQRATAAQALAAGTAAPAPSVSAAIWAGVFTLAGLLFLISMAKMHVFFRPTPKVELEPANPERGESRPESSEETTPVFITGKLYFNPKVARRFLEVPAMLITLEGGQKAFASSLDASSSFYGVVMESRAGAWLLAPEKGSVTWERGLQYCGLRGTPSLRIGYLDSLNKSSRTTAILSFADSLERERYISVLATL